MSSFKVRDGAEVSSETHGPPYQHVWWCDDEELFTRKGTEAEAAG